MDDELCLVIGVSGTTFTVIRGVEGTTPATHSAGAGVTQVVTSESLIVGAISAMYGPIVRPVLADFAWVNQGISALLTQTGFAITLTVPSGDTGENLHICKKALPGGTSWTAEMLFRPIVLPSQSTVSLGLALRESATGKIVGFCVKYDGSVQVYGWSNPTTYGGYSQLSIANPGSLISSGWVRFRVARSGSDLVFSTGNGFASAIPFGTLAVNGFLTTAPDEVGFFVNPYGSSLNVGVTVLSFEVL